ncbi:hypothetical protein MalM25_04350 [Planctomycetes bacterium MalM25]|nr:hypothetical protein MalM25_04350 [Planctomycetes bacterium MalM25]
MTPVNCFVISLLAVTFGWAPVEPTESVHAKPALPSDEGRASGYEYHVRVSPTDLEDLRAGRVDSLSSHLPDDVGPIERVRITFGEGAAPRQLTAVDRKGSKPASEAPRYVVAKPATPAWGPAPKQHVVYQNPNELTLQQGFEEAARNLGYDQQQAEQWVHAQAHELADTAVDSGIRQTQAYVGSPPGSTPYGTRPTQNGAAPTGTNGYGVNETVTPPTPTSRSTVPPAGQPTYGNPTTPQYNTSTTPNYNAGSTNPYGAPSNGTTGSAQIPLPPPPTNTTPVQPVPRSNPNDGFERNPYGTTTPQGPQLANPQGPPVLERFTNDSETYGPPGQRSVTSVRQPEPSFPSDRRPATYSGAPNNSSDVWRGGSDLSRTSYGGADTSARNPGFADRPATPPPFYGDTARDRSRNVSYRGDGSVAESNAARSWAGGADSQSSNADRDRSFAERGSSEGENSERGSGDRTQMLEVAALVFLSGFTVFTWISYTDLRHKYRAALRGAPTAGPGAMAA